MRVNMGNLSSLYGKCEQASDVSGRKQTQVKYDRLEIATLSWWADLHVSNTSRIT
jgi:hypothetical protein